MDTQDHPIPAGVVVFVAVYMCLCLAVSFQQGNTEFVMYGVAMIVYIIGLIFLHHQIGFSGIALWLLSVWGFLHMLGGTVPIPDRLVDPGGMNVLYSMRLHPDIPRYDQVIHTFGFFSATVACWEIVRQVFGVHAPRLAVSLIAALMGVGLGAMNEVLEFIATLVTETNVGGYVNTGWDLVSNTIGASLAGLWCLGRRMQRDGTSQE